MEIDLVMEGKRNALFLVFLVSLMHPCLGVCAHLWGITKVSRLICRVFNGIEKT